MSSGLLTSICSTSGVVGSLRATRSVRRTPLPTLVSRISAPASCATRATEKAMLSSVSTPVMSSFLPSSSTRYLLLLLDRCATRTAARRPIVPALAGPPRIGLCSAER